jgi:phosphatidylinositol alpha-1,6-mannosyltransferase
VVLTGGVAWEDVPALVDAGDVFALPCRTRRGGLEPEAWGIVFLEAQACGLPVLVGRSGGAPETVTDPAAGIVVAPTVPAVAGALEHLLASRVPREARTARVAWSWQQAGDRLAELLS